MGIGHNEAPAGRGNPTSIEVGVLRILQIEPKTIPCTEPRIATYLAMLEDCRRDTKTTVQDMDEESLAWRLAERDSSTSDLLYHIAFVEADWLYAEVLQESVPRKLAEYLPHEDRDAAGRLNHAAGETLESLVSRLDAVRVNLMTTYGSMDYADFRRLRRLPKYEVSPEWVIYHLLEHEAEHRGQIRLLKRKWAEAGPISVTRAE